MQSSILVYSLQWVKTERADKVPHIPNLFLFKIVFLLSSVLLIVTLSNIFHLCQFHRCILTAGTSAC